MGTLNFSTKACPICFGYCKGSTIHGNDLALKPSHVRNGGHCGFCNNTGVSHYIGVAGYHQLEGAAARYKETTASNNHYIWSRI